MWHIYCDSTCLYERVYALRIAKCAHYIRILHSSFLLRFTLNKSGWLKICQKIRIWSGIKNSVKIVKSYTLNKFFGQVFTIILNNILQLETWFSIYLRWIWLTKINILQRCLIWQISKKLSIDFTTLILSIFKHIKCLKTWMD